MSLREDFCCYEFLTCLFFGACFCFCLCYELFLTEILGDLLVISNAIYRDLLGLWFFLERVLICA